MLAGEDPTEPTGPEDAAGPGPKRGDYSDRERGSELAHETVRTDGGAGQGQGEATENEDGGIDRAPHTAVVDQTARYAEEPGQPPEGQKGGVQLSDVNAPVAPAITAPAAAATVVDAEGDVTFTGTAEPEATVEVFEGATSKGTTEADLDGDWELSITGVTAGAHTYTAKQTDQQGNVSVASGGRSITMDVTP